MIGEEEDIEGKHTFDLQEKLETERFSQLFVQEMDGKGKICKTDTIVGWLCDGVWRGMKLVNIYLT